MNGQLFGGQSRKASVTGDECAPVLFTSDSLVSLFLSLSFPSLFYSFLATPTLVLEQAVKYSGLDEFNNDSFYRHQLLDIGTDSCDLGAKGKSLQILAIMIRFYVPYLSCNTKKAAEMLLKCSPIDSFVTSSDLAFAVLVMEHYIMNWRHQMHYKQETGCDPAKDYVHKSLGLYYDGGIAGEAAKRRFNELNVYLFMEFFSPVGENTSLNMGRLQTLVDRMVKYASHDIRDMQAIPVRDLVSQPQPSLDDIKRDIVHSVFFYLYL